MIIYKYPLLRLDDVVMLDMPRGARLLCVQVQRNVPCLWAAGNACYVNARRKLYICGTGHESNDIAVSIYVGSFQLLQGGLVLHVFDGGENES